MTGDALRNGVIVSTIIGIIIIVVVAGVVANTAPTPNGTFKDAATVLAFIGLVAVGIERILEAMWTVYDFIRKSWGPLASINTLLDQVNSSLKPFYSAVESEVKQLKAADGAVKEQIDAADQDLAKLKGYVDTLKGISPTNPNLKQIVDLTQQGINYLQLKYPAVKNAAGLSLNAISAFSDFVSTFKDNPVRRLVSLFLGVLLGLVVARVFSLDLVMAALQAPSGTTFTWSSSGVFPHPGVAVTGLVIGLGSNPTHEVIRAIQQYKQSQK